MAPSFWTKVGDSGLDLRSGAELWGDPEDVVPRCVGRQVAVGSESGSQLVPALSLPCAPRVARETKHRWGRFLFQTRDG